MAHVTETDLPAESALRSWVEDADFYDAYECGLNDASLTPTEIFLRAARATPIWAEMLMSIRNRIVKLLGLKDVGNLGAVTEMSVTSYEIGDRLGIFNILAKTDSELILGIDDRHLDVRVSVLKFIRAGLERYAVSTVVKTHNRLGRIYMMPVGRIHPIIVKTLMKRAAV
jgi:hypothetical protein